MCHLTSTSLECEELAVPGRCGGRQIHQEATAAPLGTGSEGGDVRRSEPGELQLRRTDIPVCLLDFVPMAMSFSLLECPLSSFRAFPKQQEMLATSQLPKAVISDGREAWLGV